ncbi:MAG: tyrosine-type recombinase/integrase [Clostridia bacterium]|nr:tyrosine-type recombinase/integrase [Clostridia bacterium]
MSKYTKLTNFLSHLPDFVFEYIEISYTGESVNTQLGYSIDIKIFLQYLQQFKFRDVENLEDFAPKHLEQVTLRDLTGFQAYLREYETETVSILGNRIKRIRRNDAYGINRKMSGIRGLFSYLYKNDLISQNVTDKIDFKKIHQKMKRPLTTIETVDLISCIYEGEKFFSGRDLAEYKNKKQRDIALFTAYLGTGCRVSELINLNIHDVDFDTSSFIVTRKGGDQQEIFMPVQVENELHAYMLERLEMENVKDTDALFISRLGKRMTAQGVEKTLKKYCHVVGITDPDKARPHALRRTFACNMIADGIDIKMVAELMGHKNIEVTHRYYAQYASQKRKEVMRSYEVIKKDE